MRIERDNNHIILNKGNLICTFSLNNGKLLSLADGKTDFSFDGITVDAGCDGAYVLNALAFDSMLEKHTWDLPCIIPKKNPRTLLFAGFEEQGDSFTTIYELGPLELRLVYSFISGALKVHSKITNIHSNDLWINCLAFIIRSNFAAVFDFPSNVPCYETDSTRLKPYEPVCGGLVGPYIHSRLPEAHLNLVFIDPVEKWASGAWRTERGVDYAFVPALEMTLKPGESAICGDLFLQTAGIEENPYLKVRGLYEALGYEPAKDGISNGILYSCHPSGTMDDDFSLKYTMSEYAGFLDELREMGIDHIWLLPLFDHGKENVYHSTDQAVIDGRYGGDNEVRCFCEKAHNLGMTVLFDYVPHGPSPGEPLAKDHPEWCSRRREGSPHIEWNCVSFDYNHPGYLEYTKNLVHDHVKRFGIDGARIDCAMGGLSNWNPYNGCRPSACSVKAGVNITEAIRDGFIKSGKSPFIIPENFNPIPCYFPYTDVFYGMNLYRVFCELEGIVHEDPTGYVKTLTSWLEKEYWSTPAGYTKMRFLGNHDTVSWVWQSARAVDCYGLETAKALWAVITLIDGMPMIYQGDEDPRWYSAKDGTVLKDFFRKLFTARKKYLQDSEEIEYLYTKTPVMAFIRSVAGKKRLVLVNLSKDKCLVDFNMLKINKAWLLAGNADISGNAIEMAGSEYAILGICQNTESKPNWHHIK